MDERRVVTQVTQTIWEIGSQINITIWREWDDEAIQDLGDLLERARTYEIIRAVWRDGLELSSLPRFM